MRSLCRCSLAIAIFALTGCSSAMTDRTALKPEFSCSEPRPTICTQQFAPVCGVYSSGRQKTFANACSACSKASVTGFDSSPCGKEGSP